MTPDEAPVGTVVVIGHPANGVSATKQQDGQWTYNLEPTGRVVSSEDVIKGGAWVYIPGSQDVASR